jgi:sugar phosphate isomerase/epimerase
MTPVTRAGAAPSLTNARRYQQRIEHGIEDHADALSDAVVPIDERACVTAGDTRFPRSYARVDTPQEPSGARIVPFRHRPASEPTGRLDVSSAGGDQQSGNVRGDESTTVDRLLAMRTLDDPMPGEEAGVSHIRAVQLGVSSGALYPHIPTEQVAALAARLGVTTIELMLQTPGEYQPAFVSDLARQARSSGVDVHSVHAMQYLHPMLNAYPRRAAEARDEFQRVIEATATLGARVLVWHGADRKDLAAPDGWERFIALSHDLARACGEAGVTLGIENVSWCALAKVRDVVSFATRLEEIGSAREIGFVFDPFQAVEADANPFMVLAAMGNRVVDVHISDYRQGDPTARHLLPGDGDLPWSALLRAISGSGYTGPLMIEGPLGSDPEGMQRVRRMIAPLIRSVFPFPPDANRTSGATGTVSSGDMDGDLATTLVAPPAGVLKGIALFNQRRFYEQHEEIEHEWHAERGPIRRLYQGLLQIGIGYHHALNGNYRGAVALLADGIAKTSAFAPRALGIETGALVTESQACLDRITALGPDRIGEFDPATIPAIELNPV